jgi:excisionase family DNA binding protein
LGVSIKTFNKVLHSEKMPARKIGREWKFSRRALINWVGEGRSRDFYKESESVRVTEPSQQERRTAGWRIETE